MRAVLLLILIVVAPLGVSAAVPENLESATVNIYCTYRSGNKTYSSTGTGVFIDSRGVILTNAHVVQPFLLTPTSKRAKTECQVRTGSPAEKTYQASLLYLSPEWTKDHIAELKKRAPRGTGEGDFALLYVTKATEGALPERFPALTHSYGYAFIHENETVYAGGYPAEDLDFDGVKNDLDFEVDDSTIDSVRAYVRPYQEVLTLSPSSIGSAGVSGGPVVRETGELLGIVAAVSSTSNVEDRSIRAITLTHVSRKLLEDTGSNLVVFLLSDLSERAQKTAEGFSDSLKASVTKAILKRR